MVAARRPATGPGRAPPRRGPADRAAVGELAGCDHSPHLSPAASGARASTPPGARPTPQRVAETMGQMKGALMKLGQMLSFVSDDIPEEYRAALQSLQASAPPMDFALLRDVAERELGKPLERAFARFDEQPLASASIGQVHRAQLPDGEEVVVKIQYPGVAEAIAGDLANVDLLYQMMGMFYSALDAKARSSDELRARIIEELDYRARREARELPRPLPRPSLHPRAARLREPLHGARAHLASSSPAALRRRARARPARARPLRRDPLSLRLRIDLALRRVQRRSPPRQLPLRRRRAGGVPRLRLREVFPARDDGQLDRAGDRAPPGQQGASSAASSSSSASSSDDAAEESARSTTTSATSTSRFTRTGTSPSRASTTASRSA